MWSISINSNQEGLYLQSILDFLLDMYSNIFGKETVFSEDCMVYNDPNADYPMLIINCNPIRIRLAQNSLNYWAQTIYQLSHELCHYVIIQKKHRRTLSIKWFEETLCESMALYALHFFSRNWDKCRLFGVNAQFGESITDYLKGTYNDIQPSILKTCHTIIDLGVIEAQCEDKRLLRGEERNCIFDYLVGNPTSAVCFTDYIKYISEYCPLLIDFEKWKRNDSNPIILVLESIQPRIFIEQVEFPAEA